MRSLWDEKVQYDASRETAKISVLSSGKVEKHENLTGEKIVPFYKSQIIKQAKFTYLPFGKAFQKQKNWRAWEKEIQASQTLNPTNKELLSIEETQKLWMNQKELKNKNKTLIEIKFFTTDKF